MAEHPTMNAPHQAATAPEAWPLVTLEPKPVRGLVPPAGIEPATCPLGKGCSILLSYGGLHARVYPAYLGASIARPAWSRAPRARRAQPRLCGMTRHRGGLDARTLGALRIGGRGRHGHLPVCLTAELQES